MYSTVFWTSKDFWDLDIVRMTTGLVYKEGGSPLNRSSIYYKRPLLSSISLSESASNQFIICIGSSLCKCTWVCRTLCFLIYSAVVSWTVKEFASLVISFHFPGVAGPIGDLLLAILLSFAVYSFPFCVKNVRQGPQRFVALAISFAYRVYHFDISLNCLWEWFFIRLRWWWDCLI